jgi:hypothetical protein
VPSVFSVLNAFEFLADSQAAKPFNTENTEGTEENGRRGNLGMTFPVNSSCVS